MNHEEYVKLMRVVRTLHHHNDYEILRNMLNELMGYDKLAN